MVHEKDAVWVQTKRGAVFKKLLYPFFPRKPFSLPECVGPHKIKINDKADRPEGYSTLDGVLQACRFIDLKRPTNEVSSGTHLGLTYA